MCQKASFNVLLSEDLLLEIKLYMHVSDWFVGFIIVGFQFFKLFGLYDFLWTTGDIFVWPVLSKNFIKLWFEFFQVGNLMFFLDNELLHEFLARLDSDFPL